MAIFVIRASSPEIFSVTHDKTITFFLLRWKMNFVRSTRSCRNNANALPKTFWTRPGVPESWKPFWTIETTRARNWTPGSATTWQSSNWPSNTTKKRYWNGIKCEPIFSSVNALVGNVSTHPPQTCFSLRGHSRVIGENLLPYFHLWHLKGLHAKPSRATFTRLCGIEGLCCISLGTCQYEQQNTGWCTRQKLKERGKRRAKAG